MTFTDVNRCLFWDIYPTKKFAVFGKMQSLWTLQHLYTWLPLGLGRLAFVSEKLRGSYMKCKPCIILCVWNTNLLLRVIYVWFRPSIAGFLLRSPGFDPCGVGVNLLCTKCGWDRVSSEYFRFTYLHHYTFALYSHFFYLNLKSTPSGLYKWRSSSKEWFRAKYYFETNTLIF